MASMLVECASCDGTGLYVGFTEPPGSAVVCHYCKGTGGRRSSYTLFTKRKPKRGIHTVYVDQGWDKKDKRSCSIDEFYRTYKDAP